MKKSYFLLIVILIILACSFLDYDPGNDNNTQNGWICPSAPDEIDIEDLVGTWRAKYGGGDVDELVIKPNHQYKQYYYRRADNLTIETDWKSWQVEKRDDGGILLHLDGMHICWLTTTMCEIPEGGGGDFLFTNQCNGEVFKMKDEGILAVVSTEDSIVYKDAPKGIALQQMISDRGESPNVFILQNLEIQEK